MVVAGGGGYFFLKTCCCFKAPKITFINPLAARSDKTEISLYVINTFSNIQVMRIKKVITKDKMS